MENVFIQDLSSVEIGELRKIFNVNKKLQEEVERAMKEVHLSNVQDDFRYVWEYVHNGGSRHDIDLVVSDFDIKDDGNFISTIICFTHMEELYNHYKESIIFEKFRNYYVKYNDYKTFAYLNIETIESVIQARNEFLNELIIIMKKELEDYMNNDTFQFFIDTYVEFYAKNSYMLNTATYELFEIKSLK